MSFAVICDVVVPHADKSDGSVCRRPFVESRQNDMGTTAMAPVNTARRRWWAPHIARCPRQLSAPR
jgi:hypothetical protein